MKPLTDDIKQKIRLYAKNKLDISDLIKDVDIKGADLSHCIIKHLNKVDTDISNTNFSYTELGSDDAILSIIRCKMRNCNFEGAKFVGRAFVRSCEARGCNFRNADVSKADYQHTDFRDSSFCEATIKISTTAGLGCIFPTQMFKDLCQGWKMKIVAEEV